jgi:hypothetical protein
MRGSHTRHRFGFIGPVELSMSAFLMANLGHTPSEGWREAFLGEALKFQVCVCVCACVCVCWGGRGIVRVASRHAPGRSSLLLQLPSLVLMTD